MTESQYLKLNMKGLMISGLWPNKKFNSILKNRMYFLWGKVAIINFVIFHVSQVIEMFLNLNNIPVLVENMKVTFLYMMAMTKLLIIHIRWRKWEQVFNKIHFEENRILARTKEEINVYFNNIKTNHFQTKLFWFITFVSVVVINLSRPCEYLLTGPKEIYHNKIPFIISSWFPFDRYKSINFIFAYIYQVNGVIFGGHYVAITDTFYVGLIIYGIGQYQVIQQSLKNLHIVRDKNGQIKTSKDDELIDCYEEIIDIIKHHIRSQQYCDELANLIKPVVFLQFLVSSLMMCAVGLEVILSGFSVRLIDSLEVLIGLTIELLLYYWPANELTLESIKVSECIVECQWYKFTPRVKKALILLMFRCTKSTVLSVGGFYNMSLITFVKMMKSAYSFLTLFRNMNTYEN